MATQSLPPPRACDNFPVRCTLWDSAKEVKGWQTSSPEMQDVRFRSVIRLLQQLVIFQDTDHEAEE